MLAIIWACGIAGIALQVLWFDVFSRWPGLGLYLGMGWIVGVQGGAFAEKVPEYRRNALAQLREPLDSVRRLERTAREVREMTEAPSGGPRPSQVEVVGGDSELVGLARS